MDKTSNQTIGEFNRETEAMRAQLLRSGKPSSIKLVTETQVLRGGIVFSYDESIFNYARKV